MRMHHNHNQYKVDTNQISSGCLFIVQSTLLQFCSRKVETTLYLSSERSNEPQLNGKCPSCIGGNRRETMSRSSQDINKFQETILCTNEWQKMQRSDKWRARYDQRQSRSRVRNKRTISYLLEHPTLSERISLLAVFLMKVDHCFALTFLISSTKTAVSQPQLPSLPIFTPCLLNSTTRRKQHLWQFKNKIKD